MSHQPLIDIVSAHDVTADSMIARFYSRRGAGTRDDVAVLPTPNFDSLHREFAELTRRSRPVLSDHRLKLPEWSALFAMAGDVIKISKLLYAEFRRDEAARSDRANLAALAELLEFNGGQLARLDGLLRCLDRIDGYTPILQEALHELQHAEEPLPSRLQNLARRMILDLAEADAADLLTLACGSQLRDYLARSTHPADPYVYASGIQAAQFGAWMMGREPHSSERRELVTIAGLLQNCGLLCLTAHYRSTSEALAVEESTLYRRHPAIGAALASGLCEYSLDLPLLIAGHHERLDGTGYPHRLVGDQLSKWSRLSAAVARLIELLRDAYRPSGQQVGWPAIAATVDQAIAQLYRESEQGELDRECTRQLLASFGFERTPGESRVGGTGQPGPGGGTSERLRLDAAHQGVPSVQSNRTVGRRQPLSQPDDISAGSESPPIVSPDGRRVSQ